MFCLLRRQACILPSYLVRFVSAALVAKERHAATTTTLPPPRRTAAVAAVREAAAAIIRPGCCCCCCRHSLSYIHNERNRQKVKSERTQRAASSFARKQKTGRSGLLWYECHLNLKTQEVQIKKFLCRSVQHGLTGFLNTQNMRLRTIRWGVVQYEMVRST
jgi:hypothetical protein